MEATLDQPLEEERTDPLIGRARRGPSPTPVSHVGASARTVSSKRIGPPDTLSDLRVQPKRRPVLPALMALMGVALIGGAIVAVLVLPDRLGAWANAPQEGASSALEPVPIEAPADEAAGTVTP